MDYDPTVGGGSGAAPLGNDQSFYGGAGQGGNGILQALMALIGSNPAMAQEMDRAGIPAPTPQQVAGNPQSLGQLVPPGSPPGTNTELPPDVTGKANTGGGSLGGTPLGGPQGAPAGVPTDASGMPQGQSPFGFSGTGTTLAGGLGAVTPGSIGGPPGSGPGIPQVLPSQGIPPDVKVSPVRALPMSGPAPPTNAPGTLPAGQQGGAAGGENVPAQTNPVSTGAGGGTQPPPPWNPAVAGASPAASGAGGPGGSMSPQQLLALAAAGSAKMPQAPPPVTLAGVPGGVHAPMGPTGPGVVHGASAQSPALLALLQAALQPRQNAAAGQVASLAQLMPRA